jgi:excisionase family DNA binding protein
VLFSFRRIVPPLDAKRPGIVTDTEALPNILKTRDLALLLDMSPDAVNDLARKGLLKGYKSGNQWRFRRKDVERYLLKEPKKTAPPG